MGVLGRPGGPLACFWGRSRGPPSHRHVFGASGSHVGIDFSSKNVYVSRCSSVLLGSVFAMVFAFICATRFLSNSFSSRVGLQSAILLPTHKTQWFFKFFRCSRPRRTRKTEGNRGQKRHKLTHKQTSKTRTNTQIYIFSRPRSRYLKNLPK